MAPVLSRQWNSEVRGRESLAALDGPRVGSLRGAQADISNMTCWSELAELTGPTRTDSASSALAARCIPLFRTEKVMHISRAYCVEAGTIVEIYRARARFFAQDEARCRFDFLCSDEFCRASSATKIVGVNYDKLVEEGDCIAQKPQSAPRGANTETPASGLHKSASYCGSKPRTWARGQDCRIAALLRLSPTILLESSGPRPRLPLGLRTQPPTSQAHLRRIMKGQYSATRKRHGGIYNDLEIVTSAYERLEPEEQCEATLRIGLGLTFSYHKAFCRIEHYLGVVSVRIFHGGVRVQLHGPNLGMRFFDRVQRSQRRSKIPLAVSLYLKHEVLKAHGNGRFLAAQLSEGDGSFPILRVAIGS